MGHTIDHALLGICDNNVLVTAVYVKVLKDKAYIGF